MVALDPVTWIGSADPSMAPPGCALILEYVVFTLSCANALRVFRFSWMLSAVSVMSLVAERPEVNVMLPPVDSREILLAEMKLSPVELMVAEAVTATVPLVSVTAAPRATEPF